MTGTALLGVSARPAGAQDIATAPPTPGDYLVPVTGDTETPLTPAALELGGRPIRAWPVDAASGTPRNGTLYNLLLVLRWDPAALGPETQGIAAEGVVAYTVICTHAACEVSDWVAEANLAECACHFSRFDLRRNGAVVQGPAVRKLPALGLALDGDRIVVAQPFDSPVGGDVAE